MNAKELRKKLVDEVLDSISDLSGSEKKRVIFEEMLAQADTDGFFEKESRIRSRDTMDSFFHDYRSMFETENRSFWAIQ